jgi:hypothetical protein
MGLKEYLKQHKLLLQAIAFIGIIVLPFLLYWASRAHAGNGLLALLGLMALFMMSIIAIS